MEDLVSMIVNALRNISISACIDIVVVAFIFYKGGIYYGFKFI